MTPPVPFERPELGGYPWLAQGAKFESLDAVPGVDGNPVDLTHYPALTGFENLVMLVGDPNRGLAWSAVTFPEEGFAWFTLKDAKTLPHTVLWLSNGGRHYAPWNGKHRNVLGVEEVCSYFHLGAAESIAENPIRQQGFPTSLQFSKERPTRIPVVSGVVPIPAGFDRVVQIEPERDGIVLISSNGAQVRAPLSIDWLKL
jgi:hypothetical protein